MYSYEVNCQLSFVIIVVIHFLFLPDWLTTHYIRNTKRGNEEQKDCGKSAIEAAPSP